MRLASSASEKTLSANSDERLRVVLATLEECRSFLLEGGNRQAAQLLSMVMLEFRMKLNGVSEADLKALCDNVSQQLAAVERSRNPKSSRRLKIIK
jgi:hypothetical protein